MVFPTPNNESQRVAALLSYEVLDTAEEVEFDELTFLASHVCGTPIALVSLIEHDRQWFKSKVGLQAPETPRNVSFCTHAILQPDLFVITDALEDERFAANPLVTSGFPYPVLCRRTIGQFRWICLGDALCDRSRASKPQRRTA